MQAVGNRGMGPPAEDAKEMVAQMDWLDESSCVIRGFPWNGFHYLLWHELRIPEQWRKETAWQPAM